MSEFQRIFDSEAVSGDLSEDGILVLTMSNPPLNALNGPIRQGLVEAVDMANGDPCVKGILIRGAGRAFCAGADIRGFGKATSLRTGEVCNRIEASSKLVVAAIHGFALGGGLEIALGAHYRFAADGTRVGLPEILLGTIPGGGGTQRLPRLIGAERALDIMLSARQVPAQEACEMGIIDRVGGPDVLEEGLAFIRELIATGASPRRTSEADGLKQPDARRAVEKARHRIETTHYMQFAAAKLVEAVALAATEPFALGMHNEQALFDACLANEQRGAQVHAFFAERRATKAPALEGQKSPVCRHIGIVGQVEACLKLVRDALLNSDATVSFVEFKGSVASTEDIAATIQESLEIDGRREAISRLKVSRHLDSLSTADFVIDVAGWDESSLKKLVDMCNPAAVVVTSTTVADFALLPGRCIGFHLVSPSLKDTVVEVVASSRRSSTAVAAAFNVSKKLTYLPVLSAPAPGLIAVRSLMSMLNVAQHLVEHGVSPYRLDDVMKKFGFSLGPCGMMDELGIESVDRFSRVIPIPTNQLAAGTAREFLLDRGLTGKSEAAGFYRYVGDKSVEDAGVATALAELASRQYPHPREYSDEDIVRRCVAALINECACLVEESVAQRPSDIDIVHLKAFGFPRFRGGPMRFADDYGIKQVIRDLNEFKLESRSAWTPSGLLIRLERDALTFNSLNSDD